MEKGFVYVARLIDYNGNFVGNFYKVGKSLQYKVRETQLNSTHLPMDVLLVRVFETEYMSQLEKILHAALVDYRIEKKYNDRRNITTEWFDLEDDEDFHYRIDEIVKHFPKVSEINILNKITGDTQTNSVEKQELIQAINKTNRKKLEVYWGEENLTAQFAYQIYFEAMIRIAEMVGSDKLSKETWYYSDDERRYIDTFPKSYNPKAVKSHGDYYVYIGINNQNKAKVLNELKQKFSINQMKIVLTDEN